MFSLGKSVSLTSFPLYPLSVLFKVVLVPEISLTPQMFARFKNSFGDTVAILHSSLSQGERFDEWNRLKQGKAKIAIGARSCIFAPLENVGLIVVDEEHDSSYYSESNPRFHARDVAKFRLDDFISMLKIISIFKFTDYFLCCRCLVWPRDCNDACTFICCSY